MAATMQGIERAAIEPGSELKASSASVRRPSLSAVDNRPKFSILERVKPAPSALLSKPDFSTEERSFFFSIFFHTDELLDSLSSKKRPVPQNPVGGGG